MDTPPIATLIERFGPLMLATARRWSACDEDAEDAYQRAAEQALVHRPAGSENELRGWLRTTVKHEALAIARQRRRTVPAGPPERLPESSLFSTRTSADAHTHAEQLERLRHGAQALRRLKPQEIRALQLQAEGYSYRQISEITDWSHTKVNRCITEGRRAFRLALDGIESGSECDRLAPALAELVERGPDHAQLAELRPHLSTCLVCRARLRALRSARPPLAA